MRNDYSFTESRDNFARTILSMAFSCGGSVYGGYVRCLFSGEMWNDLDICMPRKNWIAFITKLSFLTNGVTIVQNSDNDQDYDSKRAQSHLCLFIKATGVNLNCEEGEYQIQIDLTDQYPVLDCDVNALAMAADTIWAREPHLLTSTIIHNIMHRVYYITNQCTITRQNKLKQKLLDWKPFGVGLTTNDRP